jgi:hypothetical protein
MAKRAFLVGINKYRSAGVNLRGCVNDVKSLAKLLTGKFDFAESNIAVLANEAATHDAILNGLETLLAPPPERGDVLVFAFCGHGTQLPRESGAKMEKLEAIVPFEMDQPSLIDNVQINQRIRGALGVNGLDHNSVSVTCIYDCCHSGLMFRELSFFAFSEERKITDGPIKNRVLDFGSVTDNLPIVRDLIFNPFSVFSACTDEETAADCLYNPSAGLNEARGAFSFGLHKLIAENPRISPAAMEPPVLATIKSISPHPQNPQYAAANKDAPVFSVV